MLRKKSQWAGVMIFTMVLFCGTAGRTQDATRLREVFESGEAAYQRGEYAQAIKFFEDAVDINPNFAPVYNYLGLAHFEQGDALQDVMWFFNVALDIDPEYADVYHNMCRVYYQRGKELEAEKACRKALAIQPDMGSAQLTLAWIYLVGKKQPSEAIVFFRRVLEKVKNPMVYFGLGLAYAQNGDSANAIDIITQLRALGENALASQLESALCKPIDVEQAQLNYLLPQTQRQPGTIVESTPRTIREPQPAEGTQPIGTSTMQIRLKGRLMGLTPTAEEEKLPVKHPGSLSGQ